jgi:RNA polymerase-binding transcription factor DksA
VKKAVPKVEAAKKTKEKIKPVAEKHMEKASINHKEELKKALSTVKEKIKEKKKVEKPFVMPKTNTERQRKYEPEFTKSVLDQSPDEYNGPTMRYSDSELVEFRELISRKLETAKKELGYLQGLITRKDQMGGDDTDNRYMTMEDGSLSMEREQLSQMASRQITFIDHLEKAMMRIENKTYGICRVTGKLIDKARLRAVPHATLSIEAKMGIAR